MRAAQKRIMKDLNFEAQKPEGLLYVGSPRQYRADCKSGQFKIGASQTVGNRLKMEVIAARFVEGEFFGYDWKKWANIIFADEHGAVSSMMIKTESLDNFLEVYRQSLQTKSLLTVKMEAIMSARSNDNGKYFAVEFQTVGDGQFTAHIAEFRAALPDGIYRLAISDGSNETNGNGKKTKNDAAKKRKREEMENDNIYEMSEPT